MNSMVECEAIVASWLSNEVRPNRPSPLDTGTLYDLFDRMNDPSFYWIGRGNGGGHSGKCCATGTCENFNI